MGPHKTQHQKMSGLRDRLVNDQSIPNREIRAALDADDYKIYKEKLEEAKSENDKLKIKERTAGQKHAEQLIKQALMLDGRGADSSVWMDKAGVALDELTDAELAEMNYWMRNSSTGVVEFDQLAAMDRPKIYVDTGINLNESAADLKKWVLVDTIDGLLGKENQDDQAVQKKINRLQGLMSSVSDE